MDEVFDAVPGLARSFATAVAPPLAGSLVTRRITPPSTLARSQRLLSVARPLLAAWPAPEVAEATSFVEQPQIPSWLPEAAQSAVSRSWAQVGGAVETTAQIAPAAPFVVARTAAAPVEQRRERLESSANRAVTELSQLAPAAPTTLADRTTAPLTAAVATAAAEADLKHPAVERAPAAPGMPSEPVQRATMIARETATPLLTTAAERAARTGEDAAALVRAAVPVSRDPSTVADRLRASVPRPSLAAGEQRVRGAGRELERVALARASRAWEPERPARAFTQARAAAGSPPPPESRATVAAPTPASSAARPSVARNAQAAAVPAAPPAATVVASPAPVAVAAPAQDQGPPSALAAVAPAIQTHAVPSAPDHAATPATTQAAPPPSGRAAPSPPDPATLAAELFEHLHARLRRELLIERERAGLLASPDRW
jgi:hypothetical protein